MKFVNILIPKFFFDIQNNVECGLNHIFLNVFAKVLCGDWL